MATDGIWWDAVLVIGIILIAFVVPPLVESRHRRSHARPLTDDERDELYREETPR